LWRDRGRVLWHQEVRRPAIVRGVPVLPLTGEHEEGEEETEWVVEEIVQTPVRPMDRTQADMLRWGGQGDDSDIPLGVRGVVRMAEGAKIEGAQVCRMRVPCSPKGLVDGNLCPLKQST